MYAVGIVVVPILSISFFALSTKLTLSWKHRQNNLNDGKLSDGILILSGDENFP